MMKTKPVDADATRPGRRSRIPGSAAALLSGRAGSADCRPARFARFCALALAVGFGILAPLSAQSADTSMDDIDSLFDDPGAMEIIDSSGDAGMNDSPADAGDATGTDSAPGCGDGTSGSATAAFTGAGNAADKGSFRWNGDFSSTVGVNANYEDPLPSFPDLADPDESLDLGITARLWFDASPDRHYRVFGKLTADYPFQEDYILQGASGVPGDVVAISTMNVSIFELFSEFNWDDQLFFRFGKQTAGWGLSRFYQIADPLSVGVKDPADPAADLEGPLALRIAFPMNVNNLYFYAVLKDSYLPENLSDASITNAGIGLKGDFLVRVPRNPIISNGELTAGAYYQKDLAPKAVFGYSTAVGSVQLFTDQAFSWGLDSARLTGEETAAGSGIYETEQPEDGLFWSATLGGMYVNNDWHFTGYGEYLFNGAGTDDADYLKKWIVRYGAETATASTLEPSLVATDLFGYLGRHNTALSLSWSEIFGTDKLSATVLYLQNWIDLSGMVNPSITLTPFDHLSIVGGISMIWGADETEWAMKNAGLSGTTSDAISYRRFTGSLTVKLGGGRF